MRNAKGNCRWAAVMVVILMMMAAAIAAPAQTFTTLVEFNGTNGNGPEFGSLVQGRNGNLYGTTAGGTQNFGSIFEINPAGMLTTLYWFCSQPSCTDGSLPDSLLLGTDGNFYGTTNQGGNIACSPANNGCGTIFRMTPNGALTTLHTFNFTDGAYPVGALVEGSDGNYYGSTEGGGYYADHCVNGCGTLFRITPKGVLTTLHIFKYTDGANPNAPLLQAADGSFYSTTTAGGPHENGTVFRLIAGSPLTTIYGFCSQPGCADGYGSYGLTQGVDGNFYGATGYGGASDMGTVFVITPDGILTTLHAFQSTDGANPTALSRGADSNFYGATNSGGSSSDGTLFQITPEGILTTLHDFDATDGLFPTYPPIQFTGGAFYGTTARGGTGGYGTVYLLSLGLGAFVETVPVAAQIGKPVTILGTKLAGASSVTFNGTPATFTVESPTALKTTVPAGATTGPVQVVTPSGTLTSNTPFQVLP